MIDFKGKNYILKFCTVCNCFKNLRVHHCRACDVCIDEFGIFMQKY